MVGVDQVEGRWASLAWVVTRLPLMRRDGGHSSKVAVSVVIDLAADTPPLDCSCGIQY